MGTFSTSDNTVHVPRNAMEPLTHGRPTHYSVTVDRPEKTRARTPAPWRPESPCRRTTRTLDSPGRLARRRSEYRQYQEPSRARVPDAVRHTFGRDQQVACAHR